MTSQTNVQERLDLLLLQLEEEGLDEAEQEDLAELLRAGPGARAQIVLHALISSQLGQAQSLPAARRIPASAGFLPRNARWIGLAVAASAVLSSAVLLQRARRAAEEARAHRSPPETIDEPTIDGSEENPVDQATLRELQEMAAAVRAASGARRQEPPRLARTARPPGPWERIGTHAAVAAMPTEHLVFMRGGKPDAHGLFGGNQNGWVCAGSQRATLNTLMAGAVLGKADWVQEGWRVIEATFARQTPEGHFGEQNTRKVSQGSCAVMFVSSLVGALDVLEGSRFGAEYAGRIASLRPALARVGGWLMRPEQTTTLRRNRGNLVDLSIPTLVSLAGLATRLADTRMQQQAITLADDLSARQRPDGSFEYQNGFDSVRQAYGVALLHLALPHLESHERLRSTVDLAGRWVARRIQPDGNIDLRGNRCWKPTEEGPSACAGSNQLNHAEIRKALLMHALRFEPGVTDLADRVLQRQLGRRPDARDVLQRR